MAEKPSRNKATSPSRTKRGGKSTPKKKSSGKRKAAVSTPTEDTPAERQGLPARAERQGSRRIHDRELTGAESKKRQEREAKRRENEVAAQKTAREERQPKGWAGLRATRGASRGR